MLKIERNYTEKSCVIYGGQIYESNFLCRLLENRFTETSFYRLSSCKNTSSVCHKTARISFKRWRTLREGKAKICTSRSK